MSFTESKVGATQEHSAHGSGSGSPSPERIDVEKHAHNTAVEDATHRSGSVVVEYNSIPVTQDNGILSKLRNLEAALDRKLGVESEAIDRVKPEDKTPQPWHSQALMALLWASGVMQISCFATGFLGPEFGLDFTQSVVITIFGTLLGGMVSGFCATMGPGTGLRQVSISRYSFGWYPSKLVAVLNVISQIGWSAVGCITGGLALSAVSDGKINLVLGVIVIAVGSLVVSFIGLRAILGLEKYAWFIFLVLFLVMYGETAGQADIKTPSALTGADFSGTCLSLLAIVYGSSASWSSIASDYYVHYPVDTSKTKVFLLTTLGITIPTCVGMVLGCCVGSAFNTNTEWADVYDDQGVGFLIQTIIYPIGFAKFLLVIFVLAGISMNCINMYSAALSVQQFARPVAIIPRFIWTLLVFGVIVALAIAGSSNLLTVLENLLALLGYWNTSFFVIVFTEHYFFRKGNLLNYDLEAWNNPAKLPVGIAGLFAFLVGFVGWFLGMVTTWYSGPIAARIGSSGGDVGNELALIFTFLAYLPVRHFELKRIGR